MRHSSLQCADARPATCLAEPISPEIPQCPLSTPPHAAHADRGTKLRDVSVQAGAAAGHQPGEGTHKTLRLRCYSHRRSPLG